ncbi:Hypothetical protein A7982_00776 [Minicystis rosea]|nr:Hypothetical protein A7982_00776 [Minicystis rosea]
MCATAEAREHMSVHARSARSCDVVVRVQRRDARAEMRRALGDDELRAPARHTRDEAMHPRRPPVRARGDGVRESSARARASAATRLVRLAASFIDLHDDPARRLGR